MWFCCWVWPSQCPSFLVQAGTYTKVWLWFIPNLDFSWWKDFAIALCLAGTTQTSVLAAEQNLTHDVKGSLNHRREIVQQNKQDSISSRPEIYLPVCFACSTSFLPPLLSYTSGLDPSLPGTTNSNPGRTDWALCNSEIEQNCKTKNFVAKCLLQYAWPKLP